MEQVELSYMAGGIAKCQPIKKNSKAVYDKSTEIP